MPRTRLPLPAAALIVALLIAACSSAPAASPTPSPSAPPSTPPSAEPSPDPTDPPATPRPSVPATPEPSEPTTDLTDEEQALVDRVRSDVRGDAPCFAIRGDQLIDGATAGVECSRNDAVGSTFRIFAFPDGREATRAYFVILDAAGVEPRTGGCENGAPGDASWAPGDGDTHEEDLFTVLIDGSYYSTTRDGCYLDDEGLAASLSLCGDGTLVQGFSQDDDIAALDDVVHYLPDGYPRDTPTAPGVCYSEA